MQLPDPGNIHGLYLKDKEIKLLGTAHVSKESVQLVSGVILEEKPDTVCVELCPSRYQAIRQKERWLEMDLIKVIKEKKAFLLLSNLLLASFQKKIAKKFGIRPGEEMIKAIETTLARTWRAMGWWSKIKTFFQLLLSMGNVDEITEEEIEKMKQQDVLETLLAEIGKSLPALRKILIDERDQYLTHKIKSAPGKRIIAVVGAGHVPGIKANWENEIDVHPLEQLPPKKGLGRFLKWFLPLAIGVLIAYGFYLGGIKKGAHMLTWWVLANGVLAGLGATIAWAHPLTILASVLAAPLTSLNPMIAAGWVSGLVEAFTRQPKVKDFENLSEDILSLSGFWRNKVTRVLLVVVFTNLGSSLGTFVAIPLMAKVL